MKIKCIVKGCENHKHEGGFEDGMCLPCYLFITTGEGIYSQAYRNTHPVKEQDDYCKAYWGNDNKFVDVFLPNSETEVIRFWNNTHPVKELTDEEIIQINKEEGTCWDVPDRFAIQLAKAILRKAQEK